MLMPKRTKYRKQMRGRMKGLAIRGSTVAFGDYGLQALEPVWMTSRQIEAARRAVTRSIRRRGKVWIRIFPDKPYTQKAAETRMAGVPEEVAREALTLAAAKLPCKTKFVKRIDPISGQEVS